MFRSIKAGSGVRRIGLAVVLASTMLAAAPGAFAQTANDIIHGLAPIDNGSTPPPQERGHPYAGSRIEDTEVTIEGRHSRAYIDYSRAIDLTVYFDYNSSRVTDRARDMLDQLGEALASAELRHYRFLIAGHTDAVGSDESNLDLSYRRAEAVRDYLVREHGIPRHRLAVKGWGRSRLKDIANPESGVNRRVEVALIVDHGTSYLDNPQGYTTTYQLRHYTNSFRGRRPWFTCPPGSRLIDPLRPDLDIDDFAAGSPTPMCRPID
jgi:outer membrane protein OmpA-like peptidoglycan-associated protein